MKIIHRSKNLNKSLKSLKQQVLLGLFAHAPARKLIRNRRAINAVISNLILITAVLVVGFAVLFWSQAQAADYQKAQTGLITQDINQLQEKISLEYSNYNSGTSKFYLLNSGSVNVTIQNVYLSSIQNPVSFTLKTFSGSDVPSMALNITSGQREGYIQVSQALPSGIHTVTIVTTRGSTFVYDFAN